MQYLTARSMSARRAALPAGEIVTLMRSTHDSAPPGGGSRGQQLCRRYEVPHNAVAATACPASGLKGQVNLAAGFDGVDDGLLTSYAAPASGDKTVMAWVKPDSTSAGQHMVLSAGSSGSWSLFRDGDTWHGHRRRGGAGRLGTLAPRRAPAVAAPGHIFREYGALFPERHRTADLAIGSTATQQRGRRLRCRRCRALGRGGSTRWRFASAP
jgi:hypothetical protein